MLATAVRLDSGIITRDDLDRLSADGDRALIRLNRGLRRYRFWQEVRQAVRSYFAPVIWLGESLLVFLQVLGMLCYFIWLSIPLPWRR
jgi:hypothetical protein